ncbi:MAG: protein kinase, partial [Acidobacteriota bacterium]
MIASQGTLIGKTVSHYEIIEQIGGGGMGIVYRGRDQRLGRQVALKFLPPLYGGDGTERLRFVQEAKAASALDHPNICTIFSIEETLDQGLFIAMPYYEGETLKERIDRGPMDVEVAVDLV